MPFNRDTLGELNVEQRADGKGRITFSHAKGTHDDRFWVLAPAVHAAEKAAAPGRPTARNAQIKAAPSRALKLNTG